MAWSTALNIAYFTVERPLYVLGIFMMLFVMFCGGFTFGKTFLTRPFFLVFGKLSFETALITPMMIQMLYSTMPNGIFISFTKVIELGLGNVLTISLGALLLHILIEYPLRRLT